jgi:hypothetical protein
MEETVSKRTLQLSAVIRGKLMRFQRELDTTTA